MSFGHDSLDPVFRPRSVALIGASRQKGSIGWDILDNLLRYEFQGLIFPVNPKAEVVHSLKCYPTVEAIPDPVDLAIVSVRAGSSSSSGGLRSQRREGLVVITAGFKEIGGEGFALEQQLLDVVRRHGMRMLGPNCMALSNTDRPFGCRAVLSHD